MNTTMISSQKKSNQRFALSGFLANISIAWKMGLMAFVLFLGTLGVAGAAYSGLQSLRYHLSNIYDFMLIPILAISEADTALADSQYHLENLDEIAGKELTESVEHIQANTKLAGEIISRYDTEWVTTTSPEFTQALQDAGKIELQQQEVAALESFHVTFNAYQDVVTKYLATVQAGRPDANINEEADEYLQASRVELELLIDINNQFADFSNVEAQTAFRRALLNGGIVLSIGLALGLFMSYLIVVSITSRLGDLTRSAAAMQAGNLEQTVSVTGRDEVGLLGRTFNSMAEQLKGLFDTLEQRVADRTKALATAAEVSRRLTTILDPRQLANDVVNEVRSTFDYYYAQIYLLDEAGENLVIAAGTGEAGASMLARGHSLPKGRGLVGRAADTMASVLVPDVSQEEGWLPNEMLPETRAEAAVPISVGNQVLGVLDVQHNRVNGLTAEDVILLESLAGQVAITLRNARSYEQSRKQAELESLVNVIGQKIQRTTSVEDTLQTAIRELGTAIGAARVRASLKPASSPVTTEPRPSYEASVAGHTETTPAD